MYSDNLQCRLCSNSGYYIYSRAVEDLNNAIYEFACRCVCSYGKSKNRFSHAQLDLSHEMYIKSMADVFSALEIAEIREQKNAKFAER